MRERTDNFMLVCRRMQTLMQEPDAPTVETSLTATDRLDDLVRRLSQRIGTRRAA